MRTRTLLLVLFPFFSINCGNPVTFKDLPLDTSGNDYQGRTLTKTQSFIQTSNTEKIDILIVDDNSGSMEDEQREMGAKFGSFIAELSDIDWQIGVTTTDVVNSSYGQGKLVPLTGGGGTKILKKSMANAETLFSNTIQRAETIDCNLPGGTCPSGDERPLKATIMAIEKRSTDNAGFFRSDSHLSVVVLSDEDEASDGKDFPGKEAPTAPAEVVNAFKTAWPLGKKLSVHGIIIEPHRPDCLTEQGTASPVHFGTHVAELAALTGGITGSICSKDFSPELRAIGDSVRSLVNSFELEDVPLPNTVRVNFAPAQDIRWRVSGKRLLLTPAPVPDTLINVSYQIPEAEEEEEE